MDDRYGPNLILAYVEDELVAADRARVDAMLAEDPALAALVADMQRNREALRGAAPLEPTADLAEGAIAAIERQLLLEDTSPEASPPPPAPKRFHIAQYLTYGGIAAVLAITATAVFQSLQSDEQPMSTVAMSEAPTPGQSLAEATLEAQRKAMREFEAEVPAKESEALAAESAPPVEEALAAAELADRDSARLADRRDSRSASGGAGFGGNVDAADAYGGGYGGYDDGYGGRSAAREEPKRIQDKTASADTPESATLPPAATTPPPSPTVTAAVVESDVLAEPVDPGPGSGPALASAAIVSEPETSLARAAAQKPDRPPVDEAHLTSLQTQTFAQVAGNQIMLNVSTTSPERSLQQVNEWAVSNRIQVTNLPADFSEVPLADSTEGFSEDAFSMRLEVPAPETKARKFSGKEETDSDLDAEQLAAQDEIPMQLGRQRLTLTATTQQVDELVAALSETDVHPEPAAVPWSFAPAWMQWQSILQPSEVEVIIEPMPESEPDVLPFQLP
ncbi:anti-sigma factor [Algisphaera agarilytica]|uniref:Anti-sigma factor RsiW n=1 Tax=Algisphaera agarilytica TaxID=1385975 RepID=A0A7X0LJD7_9BACT|nr:hypothetical protein [Algisphaera agarilytica]MBB6428732.1 anti-sigma factor RsiW [Algisphaera agarilytica]